MSARETAIAALYGVLGTALDTRDPAPVVLRNETVPQRIPAGGLVVVRDGETRSETAMFSPLAWAIEHGAEVEVFVAGATPAQRDAALDDLLTAIGAAIATDRTLGGAVEWAGPGAPPLRRHRRRRRCRVARRTRDGDARLYGASHTPRMIPHV